MYIFKCLKFSIFFTLNLSTFFHLQWRGLAQGSLNTPLHFKRFFKTGKRWLRDDMSAGKSNNSTHEVQRRCCHVALLVSQHHVLSRRSVVIK